MCQTNHTGGRVQGGYCPCSRGETPVSRALLRGILNYLPKRVYARMLSAEYSPLEETSLARRRSSNVGRSSAGKKDGNYGLSRMCTPRVRQRYNFPVNVFPHAKVAYIRTYIIPTYEARTRRKFCNVAPAFSLRVLRSACNAG